MDRTVTLKGMVFALTHQDLGHSYASYAAMQTERNVMSPDIW